MIRGVFFDVGGTLYSYGNMQPAMTSLLQELAVRLELGDDVPALAGHYQSANQEVDRLFAKRPSYLFHEYFENIFTSFLKRIDKPHLRNHFDWFAARQRDKLIGSLDIMPDCHQVLERLKSMGLYLSAVSNADENQLTPLVERAELHRWLTHWTSSEAAQSCKPDRRIFELALKKSGLAVDEVLFVGDSPEQDILGAHAAGMATVLICAAAGPAPMHVGHETPDPDFNIQRLDELPAIVSTLRGDTAR
jgi:HAD superfamily hydrolase (TIGR01509 family)